MSNTTVSLKIEKGIAELILEGPNGKPPTLDQEVLTSIESYLIELQNAEQKPRILFLRSSSDRYFCVGANINVLKETDEESIVPWVMLGHRVLNCLEDLPFPVVAVIKGYAMGGGLELSLACDLIFTNDSAKLAQSEAGLGFIPGWGATRRLSNRIGVSKAKYIFYSGKLLSGEEANDMGLTDFLGSDEELEQECTNFAGKVCANNTNALSQFKKILNDQEKRERDENTAIEAFSSISCLQDTDTKTRLNDFLNKKTRK